MEQDSTACLMLAGRLGENRKNTFSAFSWKKVTEGWLLIICSDQVVTKISFKRSYFVHTDNTMELRITFYKIYTYWRPSNRSDVCLFDHATADCKAVLQLTGSSTRKKRSSPEKTINNFFED